MSGYKPWTEEEKKAFDKAAFAAIQKGFKEAAEETMRIMGYNVIAQDGWVVKIFPDGSIERMNKIQ